MNVMIGYDDLCNYQDNENRWSQRTSKFLTDCIWWCHRPTLSTVSEFQLSGSQLKFCNSPRYGEYKRVTRSIGLSG